MLALNRFESTYGKSFIYFDLWVPPYEFSLFFLFCFLPSVIFHQLIRPTLPFFFEWLILDLYFFKWVDLRSFSVSFHQELLYFAQTFRTFFDKHLSNELLDLTLSCISLQLCTYLSFWQIPFSSFIFIATFLLFSPRALSFYEESY